MADSVPGKIIEKGKLTDEKSSTEKDVSLFCDPCDEDGKHKIAVGFCVNCQHYLCDNCFQCHCIPRPMKDHRLMNKDEMPIKRVKSVFSEACHLHEGEAVKYYCLGHEAIGCNTCMLIDHKPCQGIRVLADVAKDVEESQLYKNFEEWLNRTGAIIEMQLDTADDNIRTSNTCSAAVLENIDILEKKINERFHVMRAKVAQEANEIADRDAKRIKVLKDSVTATKGKIADMKNDIEILKTTNQNKHLFIALKKAFHQQKMIDEILDDVKDKNKVQKYEFVENGLLTNMMANIDGIGEIIDGGINTPFFADSYPEYGMPKCVPTAKHSILMAEHVRNRLCFFKDGKSIWEHKLSSGPWDLTVVEDGIVALTLPNERKVNLFSYSDSECKETQNITVDARCEGIAYGDSHLFVACTRPPKVVVLGMDGQVEKNIEISNNGCPLFDQPAYLKYIPDKKLLCVSDRKKTSIAALSLDGELQAEYETDLTMPLFILGSAENLLVIDPNSNRQCSINIETRETETEDFINSDDANDNTTCIFSVSGSTLNNNHYFSFIVCRTFAEDTDDESKNEDSSEENSEDESSD